MKTRFELRIFALIPIDEGLTINLKALGLLDIDLVKPLGS